jgi:hypothetical protein
MKKNTSTSVTKEHEDDSNIDYPILKAQLAPHIDSNLGSMTRKFHPMLEADIPIRDLSTLESKKESLKQLIDKLDVTKNTRYQRTIEDTYCNVYSFDYCTYAQVYLPTVWWTKEALYQILNGHKIEAVFNETVEPIYSSAIHDWFMNWGSHFGWKRVSTVEELQEKVNANGGVGIICAKRKKVGLSGHIVPVVPETAIKKAYRENGKVIYPLQSQAGKLNYNYFAKARKDWWNHERYSSHVFYYHD